MRKYVWIIGCIGLVSLGWFLNGLLIGKAEGEKTAKYPYLSQEYNQLYLPTYADWLALHFTAKINNRAGLTDKLIKVSFSLDLSQDGVEIIVDLITQPGWDVYLGKGRFAVSDREVRAALEEAADNVLEELRLSYFPERESGLQDREIRITFGIYGKPIAIWEKGGVRLEGE